MNEKLYQVVSFWMMTFAITLWGVTSDRTVIEPSHIVMALMAASIWTFAFAWASISAATEAPSTLDKFVICIIGMSLLIIAVAAAMMGWPPNDFFRDAPIIVLPMSVGIGLSYMLGATIRRHLPDPKPTATVSGDPPTVQL